MIQWFKQNIWQPICRGCAKVAGWFALIPKESIQAALVVCAVTAVVVGAFALACKYFWFLAALLILLGLIVLLRLAERCLLAI